MMRSMTRFLTILCIALPCAAFSQKGWEKDFSLWTWIQFEKKIRNNQYAEFQYQVRFNNNMSQFNRSNLYFIYGINFLKHMQLEALYQLNLNYEADQHTFFLSLSYKQKLNQRFSVFYRTSFQTVRNYFTGDAGADQPYSEWRNRARLNYKINNLLSTSVSAEPYLKLTSEYPAYISRIRFVSQLNYRFNKYQGFSVFYLAEPDVITYSKPDMDYVLGITYHFRFPDKTKAFKKIFRPKKLIRETGDEFEIFKDTYN